MSDSVLSKEEAKRLYKTVLKAIIDPAISLANSNFERIKSLGKKRLSKAEYVKFLEEERGKAFKGIKEWYYQYELFVAVLVKDMSEERIELMLEVEGVDQIPEEVLSSSLVSGYLDHLSSEALYNFLSVELNDEYSDSVLFGENVGLTERQIEALYLKCYPKFIKTSKLNFQNLLQGMECCPIIWNYKTAKPVAYVLRAFIEVVFEKCDSPNVISKEYFIDNSGVTIPLGKRDKNNINFIKYKEDFETILNPK